MGVEERDKWNQKGTPLEGGWDPTCLSCPAKSHLGGSPIHPAFRTGVHIHEHEALHHLRVVEL